MPMPTPTGVVLMVDPSPPPFFVDGLEDFFFVVAFAGTTTGEVLGEAEALAAIVAVFVVVVVAVVALPTLFSFLDDDAEGVDAVVTAAAEESGDGTTTTGDAPLRDADGTTTMGGALGDAVTIDAGGLTVAVPPDAPATRGSVVVLVVVVTTSSPGPPPPILSPPPIPTVFTLKPPDETTMSASTPPLPAKGRSANGSSDPVWNPPGWWSDCGTTGCCPNVCCCASVDCWKEGSDCPKNC